MKPELFKTLNESDVKIYKKWARDNFKIGTDINKVWHPVVQNECDKINQEYIDRLAVLKESK
tara:strand:+ start:207 stop:392 length:186 start_codon:yes stop_codon:yes gene_type:complete